MSKSTFALFLGNRGLFPASLDLRRARRADQHAERPGP